jgi:phenylalanyl-tRNA synthetase beta chain
MKVPLSWLRELVELDGRDITALSRQLTMAGLEVEDVQVVGADWRAITIARVTHLEKHPRLDSLKVARLDLGDRSVTVVTAAPNLRVGSVVPHVAAGGRLPSGEVGSRMFGGITSEGMVCSGDELELSPDKDGIYLLEDDAPVGQALADYLDEIVLDIYITANRPDCMAMVGIAREVHALTGGKLSSRFDSLFDTSLPAGGGEPAASSLLDLRIEDPVGCPRFTASVVRGISISPSPHWLQRRLHLAGVRPISNVVDVTNYVMLELGQPLHAFDRQRLASSSLVIRRASPDEPLTTLDGQERRLESSMMVVADQQRARSLAGIMGGADSEIVDDTRDVILEGANWDRASIRLTSAALGLTSEAARRFGRGVDPELTAPAVARATRMTLELAGGSAAGGLVDSYPGAQAPGVIHVRPSQIEALLGTSYTRDQIVGTLTALGFAVSGDDQLRVEIPSWRRYDVEGKADLAEEVGRVVGFDVIPSTLLTGALPEPRPDGDGGFLLELRARRTLAAAGLQEVITYSLVDPGLLEQLVAHPGENSANTQATLRVANPQSPELSALRPSLLGSLVLTLRNTLRQRDRALLFEIARTWQPNGEQASEERRKVGIALAGPRTPRHWSAGPDAPSVDFYDLKGVVEAVCSAFGLQPTWAPAEHPSLHPGRTAEVCLGDQSLGVAGQLHPLVAERLDLEAYQVQFAELDFERLLGNQRSKPIPPVLPPSRFPPADRDISFVVSETQPQAELERAIREAAGSLLERVLLFDVYQGGGIPAGRKSLTYALRYRAPDRTLDDDEVAMIHMQVENALRDQFGAEIRGR